MSTNEHEIMIVPDAASRKKRYRFRGGLIEKFAVVADAAYHDMDQREWERERKSELQIILHAR